MFAWRTIDRYPRLNINRIVNPQDPNGEIMLQIIIKYFPHKVDPKYVDRVVLRQRMLMQANMNDKQNYPYQMNQVAQQNAQNIMSKLSTSEQLPIVLPNNPQSQTQPNAPINPQSPPQPNQQSQSNPNPNLTTISNPNQSRLLLHPGAKIPASNLPPSLQQQYQHQHQYNQQIQSPNPPTNSNPNISASIQKFNQSDSPYLSANKALFENHKSEYYVQFNEAGNGSVKPDQNMTVKHSPYLLNNTTGFSGNYMSVPHHETQSNHITYQGVYSDTLNQVNRDRLKG